MISFIKKILFKTISLFGLVTLWISCFILFSLFLFNFYFIKNINEKIPKRFTAVINIPVDCITNSANISDKLYSKKIENKLIVIDYYEGLKSIEKYCKSADYLITDEILNIINNDFNKQTNKLESFEIQILQQEEYQQNIQLRIKDEYGHNTFWYKATNDNLLPESMRTIHYMKIALIALPFSLILTFLVLRLIELMMKKNHFLS